MILTAMSCLIGRDQLTAARELHNLGDGLQLTGGCRPHPDFFHFINYNSVPFTYHHVFSWEKFREPVWPGTKQSEYVFSHGHFGMARSDKRLWTVHPPRRKEVPDWKITNTSNPVEVMYHDYHLSTENEVRLAMFLTIPLVVDISHCHISGLLPLLQDYNHITEIHISASDGHRDLHRPITKKTFGLDWAKEREKNGTLVVYESYLHRVSPDERLRQIELIRN